jgi:photosystem II stability/assembly factor-like uncharacterized protein
MNVTIWQISVNDDVIFLSSPDGYLAKCYGDCSNPVDIPIPNPSSGYNQVMQVIDTNLIFMSSTTQLPNHTLLYKSTDAMNTWELILDDNNLFTYSYLMFDSLRGSVFGSFYERIVTSDGGANWSQLNDWLIATTGVYYLNDSTAFAGLTQTMMRTLDKGLTWDGALGYGGQQPIDIFALSADSIFVVSRGGSSRRFSYCFNLGAEPWVEHFTWWQNNAICYKSLNEIYVAGAQGGPQGWQRAIFKTTDLGASWEVFNFQDSGELFDMELINDSTALVSGTGGYLARWSLNSPMELLDIGENSINSNWMVTPNPANDEIIISDLPEGTHEVIIVNAVGAEVLKIKGYSSAQSIDISALSKGVYYLRIGNSSRTLRLIKN